MLHQVIGDAASALVAPLSTMVRTIASRPLGGRRALLWTSIRFSPIGLKLRNLSLSGLDRMDNLLRVHI